MNGWQRLWVVGAALSLAPAAFISSSALNTARYNARLLAYDKTPACARFRKSTDSLTESCFPPISLSCWRYTAKHDKKTCERSEQLYSELIRRESSEALATVSLDAPRTFAAWAAAVGLLYLVPFLVWSTVRWVWRGFRPTREHSLQ